MKLTPKQAAERAVVSVSLVYQWCQDGVLIHYRFGRQGKRGRIRIEDTDLEVFLTSCKQDEVKPRDPMLLKHIKLK